MLPHIVMFDRVMCGQTCSGFEEWVQNARNTMSSEIEYVSKPKNPKTQTPDSLGGIGKGLHLGRTPKLV